MASTALTVAAILASIVLLLALIYTNIMNNPSFAAKMPKSVVEFVTNISDPRTDEQKRSDDEHKKAAESYSKDVDKAIQKAIADKVKLAKVWKSAVHAALSARLATLRSIRDKKPRGKEREAANDDVDQFEELYPFLEYVFDREMKEDPFKVLSPMIPIIKDVGASESTVDYILRSPQEWVKIERKNADNVANYVIHVFSKEAEFAIH